MRRKPARKRWCTASLWGPRLAFAFTCEVAQDDFIEALLGDEVFSEKGLHSDFIDFRLFLQLASRNDLGRQHLSRPSDGYGRNAWVHFDVLGLSLGGQLTRLIVLGRSVRIN